MNSHQARKLRRRYRYKCNARITFSDAVNAVRTLGIEDYQFKDNRLGFTSEKDLVAFKLKY